MLFLNVVVFGVLFVASRVCRVSVLLFGVCCLSLLFVVVVDRCCVLFVVVVVAVASGFVCSLLFVFCCLVFAVC